MNKEKTHKLILIIFSWFQHIAGTYFPILEQNTQPTQHINSVWISDFIRLLKKFKVQLNIRNTNIKQHQQQNDWFIMNDVHQYTSSTHKVKLIKACRLYLQVTFLFEITNLDGDTIIYGATIGFKQDLLASKLKWTN